MEGIKSSDTVKNIFRKGHELSKSLYEKPESGAKDFENFFNIEFPVGSKSAKVKSKVNFYFYYNHLEDNFQHRFTYHQGDREQQIDTYSLSGLGITPSKFADSFGTALINKLSDVEKHASFEEYNK